MSNGSRGLSSNGTENLHKAARLKAAGHSGRARSGGRQTFGPALGCMADEGGHPSTDAARIVAVPEVRDDLTIHDLLA